MSTAKEEAHKLIDELPDDDTWEDIEYEVYVRNKIERGLEEAERSATLTHEEVMRRMAKWLDPVFRDKR
jgi:predicted transcriptional regulator